MEGDREENRAERMMNRMNLSLLSFAHHHDLLDEINKTLSVYGFRIVCNFFNTIKSYTQTQIALYVFGISPHLYKANQSRRHEMSIVSFGKWRCWCWWHAEAGVLT